MAVKRTRRTLHAETYFTEGIIYFLSLLIDSFALRKSATVVSSGRNTNGASPESCSRFSSGAEIDIYATGVEKLKNVSALTLLVAGDQSRLFLLLNRKDINVAATDIANMLCA